MSNFNTKKEGEEYLAKKFNITIKNKDKGDEIIETSLDEYVKILAYVMFCTNINKDSKYKASMMVNYFRDFKYDCKLLSDIPDVLIIFSAVSFFSSSTVSPFLRVMNLHFLPLFENL